MVVTYKPSTGEGERVGSLELAGHPSLPACCVCQIRREPASKGGWCLRSNYKVWLILWTPHPLHTHTLAHACTCACSHVYLCIHVSEHTCTSTHMHLHIYTHAHSYTVHRCICTHREHSSSTWTPECIAFQSPFPLVLSSSLPFCASSTRPNSNHLIARY